MPRPLRRKSDPSSPPASPAPQAPQEAASSTVRIALTPDNLARAFVAFLGSGPRIEDTAALFASLAWAHGLVSAMLAAAPLPAADFRRIAGSSRDRWLEGLEQGLRSVASTRAKRTQARGRANRVFCLGADACAWSDAYDAADLCDDALALVVPQLRCPLVDDLSHDAEAA